MSCSRADEPLQAFRDVSPQVAANGQLDGAPSGSHVDTQFSITTTVCSATEGHFGRCTRTVMTAGKSDLS